MSLDNDQTAHPGLQRARRGWESRLLESLRHHTAPLTSEPAGVPEPELGRRVAQRLRALADTDHGPSVSGRLMKTASAEQFAEFLIHRSLYHLKEADPHTWSIPRLSGAVKAAMITVQLDEYGLGDRAAMHAQLFRDLLDDWSLDSRYGHFLDVVPGVTLLSSNLISLFGLQRRWRGALVGHLTLFEMTSSTPNGRYARGHRRLGGGQAAARFFDEHVVADAVHEQIAAHELAAGLARTEPQLVDDIDFGARCSVYADLAFGRHLLGAWDAGRSSLREPALVR